MVHDHFIFAPLRVALVSGGLKLGGSTTFLCNLGGELVRRGIPVEVFSFEFENPLASEFNRLNVPVILQDDRRQIFEDRLSAILLRLRQFQPTVVLACLSAVSFEVLRYLPSGVLRIGLVQSHDPAVYQMARFYTAHLDAIVGVSRTIQETLEAMPEFTQIRALYLPYGVPMPETIPAADLPSEAPLRILYLGRLEHEQKRVRLFPKILEQLKVSGIPFHWTIAGDGSEKDFLRSGMKSGADQTVSFPGTVPYAEVPHVLSRHDIFLLASDYEGLPLSLLEAMGWGLVPVVSDLTSGIRELVDETTGKRVNPENLDGYAQEIIWLHYHRAEMARIRQNARAKVQREFSVTAMTDRWLKSLPSTNRAIEWPKRWSIRPPLTMPRPVYFSPPMRILRRLALRLRPRPNSTESLPNNRR